MVYGNGSLKVGNGTKIRDVRGIGSLTLVWGGGGGKGLGGGLAQGEGTLECRTLGGVIPRQGWGKRSWRSGPDKEGGPLLKYASWL
jgi:hypothetical protein